MDDNIQIIQGDALSVGFGGIIRTGRNGVSSTFPTLTLSTFREVNMAKEQPTLFPPSQPKNDGRFRKGERRSIATEFKKGEHWRTPQSFRDKDWLIREYILKGRSTGEIAEEFNVTDGAILFWLNRHGIQRRTVSGARGLKHWGLAGEKNGMYGKRGDQSVNWKGGVTAERQAFYSSQEWKTACSFVWKRDKAMCQRCTAPSRTAKLHVHHITSFAVASLRAEKTNLILLCIGCHRWVHSKANTEDLFINREWKS